MISFFDIWISVANRLICEIDRDERHLFDACFDSLPECCAGGSASNNSVTRIQSIAITSPQVPLSNSSGPPSLLTPPSSPLETQIHPSNSMDAASASAGTKTTSSGTFTSDENDNINVRGNSGFGQEPFPYQNFMEWVGANVPFMGDCGEMREVQLNSSMDSLPPRNNLQECVAHKGDSKEQLQQPLQQQLQHSNLHPIDQKSSADPANSQNATPRLEKQTSSFGSNQSSWLSGHSYLIQQTVAATESSVNAAKTECNYDVNASEKEKGTVAVNGYKRNRSSLVMTGSDKNRIPPRYNVERTQSLERMTQQQMKKEFQAHNVCRSTSYDLAKGQSNSRPGTPASLGLPTKPPSPCRSVSSFNNKLRRKNNSRPNTPLNVDCSDQDVKSTDCPDHGMKAEISASSCGPYSCDDTCGAAYQVDDACTLRNLDDSTVTSSSSVGTNPNFGRNTPSCSQNSITATLLSSDNRTHRSAPNSRPASPFHGGMPISLDKLLSGGGSNAAGARDDVDVGTASHAESSKGKEEISISSATNASSESLHKRIRSWGRRSNANADEMNASPISKEDDTAHAIAKHVIDIAPYAVLHDELLEALIDESLKVSSERKNNSIATTKMDANLQPTDAVLTSNETRHSTTLATKEHSPNRISRTPSAIWKRNKSKQSKGSSQLVANELHHRLTSDNASKSSPRNDLGGEGRANGKRSREISTNFANSTTSKTRIKNPLDLIHPRCQLMKEKGTVKKDRRKIDALPSAVGREATLVKLKEKLSLLGDIESGKFGKAAEMLRSDAVAFALREQSRDAHSSRSSHLNTIKESGSVENAAKNEKSKSSIHLVETRSLLTLQMGFVSMSYGILLQWDCASSQVVLIVLRKMCRDDFLVRNDVEYPIAATAKPSKLCPVTTNTTPKNLPDIPKSSDNSSVMSMVSLPPNPMAALVPKFLNESSLSEPPSLLSVSVLNVKQLHGGCKDCWNNADEKGENGASISNRRMNRGKSKGKQSIRPYIRFVLGKHEHLTKPAKFNNGNPAWYRVHNNSCLLPCPSDGYRWFAGQEDLIVEVRNKQSTGNSGGEGVKGPITKRLKEHTVTATDPVLAVVTVPLRSVNIEEDESDKSSVRDRIDEDENDIFKTSISEKLTPRRLRKRKSNINSNERASSTVTLPLRMRSCPSAPFGSISLQITIKTPSASASAPIPSRGNTEPESIEIGPFTKLMNDWSLEDTATRKDSLRGNNSPKTETSKPSFDRKVSYKRKLRNRFRWSKKYDHSKKEWSTLPPSASNTSSTCKKDDSSNSGGEANWFTFLFRESNKDQKEQKSH
ncbi:hypothetical protein ACHAXS_006160 [Conticribra weissflogii]